MHKYKVTCQKCGDSDVLTFNEADHILVHNDKVMLSPITAVRWRPDQQWGYECRCGNYDLLADKEKGDFDQLVSGSPMRVQAIAAMLKEKVRSRFMVEAA